LDRGTDVLVIGSANEGGETWYQINTGTHSGWVHSENVSLDPSSDIISAESDVAPPASSERTDADEQAFGDEAFVPEFSSYSETPILQSQGGLAGYWDAELTGPGAVLFHQGLFHMFYNAVSDPSEPGSIGYAISEDGYVWQRVSKPVLTSSDVAYASFTIESSTVLVQADGTWVMYFNTQDANRWQAPAVIGRATAPHPTGPWTPDESPVMGPGRSESWDSQGVRDPEVIKTDDGYVMYYTGFSDRWRIWGSWIGMATSPDGINWEKYDNPATTEALFAESDVVIERGADWEVYEVRNPQVRRTATEWQMFYLGAPGFDGKTSIGYASSLDGVTSWSRFETNPVVVPQDVPGGSHITDSELFYHDGTFFLYYLLLQDDKPGIFLATLE
jgi:predicted GH43/DUF377 family glycosyl hydrolase